MIILFRNYSLLIAYCLKSPVPFLIANKSGVTSRTRMPNSFPNSASVLLDALTFQTCGPLRKGNNTFQVHFDNFGPGSVIAFDITMESNVKNALGQLRYVTLFDAFDDVC